MFRSCRINEAILYILLFFKAHGGTVYRCWRAFRSPCVEAGNIAQFNERVLLCNDLSDSYCIFIKEINPTSAKCRNMIFSSIKSLYCAMCINPSLHSSAVHNKTDEVHYRAENRYEDKTLTPITGFEENVKRRPKAVLCQAGLLCHHTVVLSIYDLRQWSMARWYPGEDLIFMFANLPLYLPVVTINTLLCLPE